MQMTAAAIGQRFMVIHSPGIPAEHNAGVRRHSRSAGDAEGFALRGRDARRRGWR